MRTNPRLDSRDFGLSITDSDLWVHRYLTKVDRCGTREINHLMLVEVKTFSATVPFAQADTFAVINAVLHKADGIMIPLPAPQKGVRMIRVWGVHVLRMTDASPEESQYMWWDDKKIDLPMLEEVLRFERDPFTMRKRSDRRHHIPHIRERLQRVLHL